MINHVLHVFTLALYSLHVNTGSIKSVSIKGSKTGWLAMSRGANWQSNAYLDCQSLSFSITTTDGATRVFLNVLLDSFSRRTHAAASLDPFVVTFSPPIWVTTTPAASLAVASHPTPLFSAASHAPLVVTSIIAPYPLCKIKRVRSTKYEDGLTRSLFTTSTDYPHPPTQQVLASANLYECSDKPHMKYYDVWVISYDLIISFWIRHGNVEVLRLGSVTIFALSLHLSIFRVSVKVNPNSMSEFLTVLATNDNQPIPVSSIVSSSVSNISMESKTLSASTVLPFSPSISLSGVVEDHQVSPDSLIVYRVHIAQTVSAPLFMIIRAKSRQTRLFPIALSYGSRVFQLFLRANNFRQSSIKIPRQDHTPMLLSVTYTLSKEKESLPSPVLVSTNCLQTRCLGSPVVGSYSDFSMFFGTSVSGFQVKHLYGYLRPFNTLIALLFVYCLAVEINSGCNRLNPFDF
ncbi:hypothetical protein Bca101_070330 [Brassica carinata]